MSGTQIYDPRSGFRSVDCPGCIEDCCPTPDLGCVSSGPCCEPDCGCSCCKPKDCYQFRARDAITLFQGEMERLFTFREYVKIHTTAWVRKHVMIKLRRVSSCEWQWSMCALSVTSDHKLRFRWPDGFLRAPHGYYEGQAFIDGNPVNKMYFLKQFSKVDVNGSEPVFWDCANPCNQNWVSKCCLPPELEQDLEYPCKEECEPGCSGGCS